MHVAVEAAVLNRFGDVRGADLLGGVEVGDGAGDLQDAPLPRSAGELGIGAARDRSRHGTRRRKRVGTTRDLGTGQA